MAVIEKRVASDGSISFRAKVRRAGELPISKTFKRRTDAEAWAREIEVRADRGFAIPAREQILRPVSEAIDAWKRERLPELAVSDQKNSLTMADWWSSKVGRLAIAKLTPEVIEKFRNELRDEVDPDTGERVRSPARVNRYLATLSRILGYAHKTLRLIDTNPCIAVRRFKEPPGRVRFLAETEVERLLDAVDARRDRHGNPKDDFALFVRIALFTGARRGEVAGLEWRDIDFVHNRITYRDTKNGSNRTVPMPGPLVEAFTTFAKVRPLDQATRLFPHNFRHDWTVVEKAVPNFRFHDTRHNVASQLAMAGASLLDIAEVTGHKTLTMVKRYSHLSDTHVRSKLEEAAARIAPRKK